MRLKGGKLLLDIPIDYAWDDSPIVSGKEIVDCALSKGLIINVFSVALGRKIITEPVEYEIGISAVTLKLFNDTEEADIAVIHINLLNNYISGEKL